MVDDRQILIEVRLVLDEAVLVHYFNHVENVNLHHRDQSKIYIHVWCTYFRNIRTDSAQLINPQ